MEAPGYRIYLHENFHFMEPGEGFYLRNSYPDLASAEAAARALVEEDCRQYGYNFVGFPVLWRHSRDPRASGNASLGLQWMGLR